MPFTVDVDFYYDVLHHIGCPPSPEASRRLEGDIEHYLRSFPPAQTERWWRAWYRARVGELEPAQQRALRDDAVLSTDVDRWLAVTRAVCQIANAFIENEQPWSQALPIVDFWLSWRDSPDSPRLTASLGAGWDPGPPRLRGEPDPVRQ